MAAGSVFYGTEPTSYVLAPGGGRPAHDFGYETRAEAQAALDGLKGPDSVLGPDATVLGVIKGRRDKGNRGRKPKADSQSAAPTTNATPANAANTGPSVPSTKVPAGSKN